MGKSLVYRLGRGVRAIQTVYFWFSVMLTTTAGFFVQVFCWIFLLPVLVAFPRFRIELMGRIVRFFSVLGGFYLHPFWNVKIVRQPPAGYRPKDTLLMVNHISGADAWVVAKAIVPWEMKFVYKADMRKLPIGGWSLYMSYDIPIHFTKEKGGWGTAKGSVARMFDDVHHLMSHDMGIVVFPEGTRSKSGRLQLFKDGFFRYAVEKGCEILPCVSHNTRELWPLGSSLVGGGTAYFAFGDPIRVEAGETTVEDIKEKVRNAMINLFQYCPKYDPETEGPSNELPQERGHGIRGK